MRRHAHIPGNRTALLGLMALLSVPIVAEPAEARSPHHEDRETCESFGAPYGSPGHTRCMLTQQRRRDVAPLHAAEQQQINAETARSNLDMVRRMRCEREARKDHANGTPPRRC
jgi:hypothetical protein